MGKWVRMGPDMPQAGTSTTLQPQPAHIPMREHALHYNHTTPHCTAPHRTCLKARPAGERSGRVHTSTTTSSPVS